MSTLYVLRTESYAKSNRTSSQGAVGLRQELREIWFETVLKLPLQHSIIFLSALKEAANTREVSQPYTST